MSGPHPFESKNLSKYLDSHACDLEQRCLHAFSNRLIVEDSVHDVCESHQNHEETQEVYLFTASLIEQSANPGVLDRQENLVREKVCDHGLIFKTEKRVIIYF